MTFNGPYGHPVATLTAWIPSSALDLGKDLDLVSAQVQRYKMYPNILIAATVNY